MVPVFIWRLDLMILMGENPLLGQLEGVGPENLDFFGPNGTRFTRCHFRAHPFQWPSKWICPHQSQYWYVTCHLNKRYINC
jgi:hypothetical protein